MQSQNKNQNFTALINAKIYVTPRQVIEKGTLLIQNGKVISTGKDIVIIDDICDTGGTLVKAAALLKEKGARTVRALITHPVLSGKAYENIENSVLEELVVCDTIPLSKPHPKITVLTVADLFAIAIRNAYENKSITSLFVHAQLKARG